MALEKTVHSIDEIISDVKRMGKDFAKGLTEQADKDMFQSFDKIIDEFYKYKLKGSYHRHYGLYHALQSHTYKISGYSGAASMTVSPNDMPDSYRRNKNDVFDLAWNFGIHGLPSNGDNELSNEFVWLNTEFTNGTKNKDAGFYIYSDNSRNGSGTNMGMSWVNQWYSGQVPVSISVNSYKSISSTPDKVMRDIVDNWWEVGGKLKADKIKQYIIDNY